MNDSLEVGDRVRVTFRIPGPKQEWVTLLGTIIKVHPEKALVRHKALGWEGTTSGWYYYGQCEKEIDECPKISSLQTITPGQNS